MAATLLLWQALHVQERERIAQTTRVVAESVKSEVSIRMDTRILTLVQLLKFVKRMRQAEPRNIQQNQAC
jgi:hypothetical protein